MSGPRALQHITACILQILLWQMVLSQTITEGVDRVTLMSNNLVPKLLGSSNENNVVVGPFGLASTTAMLLEASSGETRQQLLAALNVIDDDISTMRVGFKAYCRTFLEHSSNPEAAGTFNSAIVNTGFELSTAYKSLLSDFYCASFAENVTDGDSGVLRLESHSGVMSHWKDFEKLAVYTFLSHQDIRPFTRRDGISRPVPMIPQVGVFRTTVWKNAKVILLPLESTQVDLLIILPERSSRINSLGRALTSPVLSAIMGQLEDEELEVFLPQLTTVSRQLDLAPTLTAMGVTRAFSQDAEITAAEASEKTQVVVAAVTQDAYISTSFTSLNAVAGESAHLQKNISRRKRDTSRVYLTKPFLFFVVHKDTNLVLLAGKIEDPVQVPRSFSP